MVNYLFMSTVRQTYQHQVSHLRDAKSKVHLKFVEVPQTQSRRLWSVYVCVCLCVSKITGKNVDGFQQNFPGR